MFFFYHMLVLMRRESVARWRKSWVTLQDLPMCALLATSWSCVATLLWPTWQKLSKLCWMSPWCRSRPLSSPISRMSWSLTSLLSKSELPLYTGEDVEFDMFRPWLSVVKDSNWQVLLIIEIYFMFELLLTTNNFQFLKVKSSIVALPQLVKSRRDRQMC